jgi:hypothetical protein
MRVSVRWSGFALTFEEMLVRTLGWIPRLEVLEPFYGNRENGMLGLGLALVDRIARPNAAAPSPRTARAAARAWAWCCRWRARARTGRRWLSSRARPQSAGLLRLCVRALEDDLDGSAGRHRGSKDP